MPPAEAAAEAAAKAAAQRRPSAVGDGGSSWRLKALQRAQASAVEQGLDVSEVRADDVVTPTLTRTLTLTFGASHPTGIPC